MMFLTKSSVFAWVSFASLKLELKYQVRGGEVGEERKRAQGEIDGEDSLV